MGLFLRQDDTRSQLQSKVAADLQERLKERAAIEESAHEPAMLENQHETRTAGLVMLILGAILLLAGIFYLLRGAGIF